MSGAPPQLRVSIPACQVGAEFVTFGVLVERGEAAWTVRRRYNDFGKLHAAVAAAAAAAGGSSSAGGLRGAAADQAAHAQALPELPPKAVRLGLSRFAPDFIEERRAALEAYLSRLVACVDPERCEPLDDFLDYAEHWLKEAVGMLGDVKELQQVVRMLRQAAETAAAGSSRRAGAVDGGTGAAAAAAAAAAAKSRRRASDDTDDGNGADEAGGSVGAGVGAAVAGGPDLVAVLREVVRMMLDYSAMLRSQAEDSEERGEATAASNSALSARLRSKQEDISDAQQMVAALRQARLRECAKERLQLQVVSQQVRTVAAELHRVSAEGGALRSLAGEHVARLAALRTQLAEWERGAAPGAPPGVPAADAVAAADGPAALVGISPLTQVAALCVRSEEFAREVDAQAVEYAGRVVIPSAGSAAEAQGAGGVGGSGRSDGVGDESSAAIAAAQQLLAGAVVSGPSLGAALLLRSAAADSASLLRLTKGLAGRRLVSRARLVVAAAPAAAAAASPQAPMPALKPQAQQAMASGAVPRPAGTRLNPAFAYVAPAPEAPAARAPWDDPPPQQVLSAPPANPFAAAPRPAAAPKAAAASVAKPAPRPGNPF